jgi:hypothetical protein
MQAAQLRDSGPPSNGALISRPLGSGPRLQVGKIAAHAAVPPAAKADERERRGLVLLARRREAVRLERVRPREDLRQPVREGRRRKHDVPLRARARARLVHRQERGYAPVCGHAPHAHSGLPPAHGSRLYERRSFTTERLQ